jgi:hypothetical protein
MALLIVLLQVMVTDSPLLPWLVGKGLTAGPVLQSHVPVSKVLLQATRGLQLLVLVGGHMFCW